MTDIVEAVALRLRDFIQAAERKAGSYVPPGFRTELRKGKPMAPILAVCEECLSKLKPEERAEFDRMIRKMSGII